MSEESLSRIFNAHADNYDKMRPNYPDELYRDIFDICPLSKTSRALEIGIGSGQASLPILESGAHLTAIEPGDRLAARCRARFSAFANLNVIECRFEDFSAEAHSFDLIYAATAFHWIPEAIGYPKVRELLAYGGAFARFRNHPAISERQLPLHNSLQELYKIYMHSTRDAGGYTLKEAEAVAKAAEKYGFRALSTKLYRRTRRFDAPSYTALLGTYSDHLALPEDIRREFFSRIEVCINENGGFIELADIVDLQIAVAE